MNFLIHLLSDRKDHRNGIHKPRILFNIAPGQKTCADYKDCSTCATTSDCTGGQCTWCASTNSCVPFLLNLCPLNSRINVAYNCPKPVPYGIDDDYDDGFARRNLTNLLCASNEGRNDTVQEVLNKVYPGIVVPDYYSVDCLGDNSINILGFGKNSSVNPVTAVAFLGNPFSLPVLVDSPAESGRVYSTFNDAFSKLWQSGLATDYSTLLSAVPGYETVILGYSVGGGVASIAADVISKRFLSASGNLKLFTFSCPRVGDLGYVMNHEQIVPSSFRVINQLDPLSLVPPRDFNFDPPMHYRYEVWYKSGTESKDFTIFHMAEDPAGRVSNLLSNNNDGINYFGKNLLTCRL
ncbi:hypothetical protein FO519_009309 [Halicephalobus sp. NKZ332]|nr:hypothetical protein FO519_009309 [Halicephalobus sp. NKZ332]